MHEGFHATEVYALVIEMQSVPPKATTSNAVWAQRKVQLQIRTRFTMFIGRTAKAAKSAFLLVFH